jgi:hypothetical protein
VTVDVWHSPGHGSAHYGGLQTCGSVWMCPVCSAKVSERRRELLAKAIAVHTAAGGRVLLATYTFSHRRCDALSATLDGFLAAQSGMTRNRPYRRVVDRCGYVGSVSALEVTWGRANGWHPHRHTLLFLGAEVDEVALAEGLYVAWARAAFTQGLRINRAHGVKLQATTDAVAEYVAKWGHAPSRRPWAAADELTKSQSKRAHRDELPVSRG